MGTMGTSQYLQEVTAFPSAQTNGNTWEQNKGNAQGIFTLFPLFPLGN